ncbi:Ig-like domain-containing protein [Cytobacillus suaedae]|nr:Ig-like domain-containing protein [Cytobacillus suaedae]
MFIERSNVSYKVFVFLLLTCLLFLHINVVHATSFPTIVSSAPSQSDRHTPIDTEITVTFNDKVKNIFSTGIKLYQKTAYGFTNEISIDEIRRDNNSIKIITLDPFTFNKEYKVVIPAYSIELDNGYYPYEYAYTFQTNYMDFHELMVLNEPKLTQLLTNYSPRQLKVFAPKRHIDELQILHKVKGNFEDNQTSTNGVTNIDIKTSGNEVDTVHVDIKRDSQLVNKGFARKFNYDAKTGSLSFDIGFNKMPGYYDVIIRVFNKNGEEIDRKTIKFGTTNGKLITDIKETYKYETAGNSYTLQELLADEKLFNTLLNENEIRSLKVQVNTRP